jgi:hypothetical protein
MYSFLESNQWRSKLWFYLEMIVTAWTAGPQLVGNGPFQEGLSGAGRLLRMGLGFGRVIPLGPTIE